ncbi:MAG: DUF2264 domain-containing protein [Clostridia bacterium]|nr:DUF2264 domain-containing protein [Clostridia bacterium]
MTPNQLPIRNNPLKSRGDFQEAVKQLCEPLRELYSEGGAQLHAGNTASFCSESVALLEAFARPLWGLVPLWAGSESAEFCEIYLKGIRNGTNPDHKEYWGDLENEDQRMVEMAVLALSVVLAPDRIWQPLSESEKKNFAGWMREINDRNVHDNNWLFFRVFVNLALKKVDAGCDVKMLERDLNRLEEFYLSDGWYRDGMREQRDYYIPFAMHYYSLIYAKVMGDEDPERAKRFKDRAARFAKDFLYWFAKDGSAIPFGRSLIYRFAQSCFWGALAYAGVEALPWGVIKGLLCRNLRWWFSQPIFDRNGVLTLGYAYPNLHIVEGYNAPGSPYWAMKAFLPLALQEDHPFWKAEEMDMPILQDISVQQHPHMLVCRDESGNHVFALTSGQHAAFEPVHCAAKYEKFAYSNIFGFSVPRGNYGLEQGAYDSSLALSEGDHYYRVRHKCEEISIENNRIYSLWKPWEDVSVKTWLVPLMPWHIRVHLIKTCRHLDTAEGGFAIATERNRFIPDKVSVWHGKDYIAADYPWGISGIVNLVGERKPEMIQAEPNTNLLHQKTMIPTLKGKLHPGIHLLICAVLGELPGGWNPESSDSVPKVRVTDNQIEIEFYNNKQILVIDSF